MVLYIWVLYAIIAKYVTASAPYPTNAPTSLPSSKPSPVPTLPPTIRPSPITTHVPTNVPVQITNPPTYTPTGLVACDIENDESFTCISCFDFITITCTCECKLGYVQVGGSKNPVCTDGLWDPVIIQCELEPIPEPTKVPTISPTSLPTGRPQISSNLVTVDDFTDALVPSPGLSVEAGYPNRTTAFFSQTLTNGSSILGRERDVQIEALKSQDVISVVHAKTIISGFAASSAESIVFAKWTFTWDGLDDSPAVNTTGLGGLNLQNLATCPQDSMSLFIRVTDQNHCHFVQVRIHTSNSVSSLTQQSPHVLVPDLNSFICVPIPGVMQFPMHNFSHFVDVENIGAVSINVNTIQQRIEALDFTYDSIVFGCCHGEHDSISCEDDNYCTRNHCDSMFRCHADHICPAPTPLATNPPTSQPTILPSDIPTLIPTSLPTPDKTEPPTPFIPLSTPVPTNSPTPLPTSLPVPAQTQIPTPYVPVPVPTVKPTQSPTSLISDIGDDCEVLYEYCNSQPSCESAYGNFIDCEGTDSKCWDKILKESSQDAANTNSGFSDLEILESTRENCEDDWGPVRSDVDRESFQHRNRPAFVVSCGFIGLLVLIDVG